MTPEDRKNLIEKFVARRDLIPRGKKTDSLRSTVQSLGFSINTTGLYNIVTGEFRFYNWTKGYTCDEQKKIMETFLSNHPAPESSPTGTPPSPGAHTASAAWPTWPQAIEQYPDVISHVLGLNDQSDLSTLVGDYLLMRYSETFQHYLIAHMQVAAQHDNRPARFTTTRSQSMGGDLEPLEVDGILFFSAPLVLNTIGKARGQPGMRMSVLRRITRQQSPGDDLWGVRIGTGSTGDAQAYRIVAMRVSANEKLPRLAAPYTLDSLQHSEIATLVPEIGMFAAWVSGKPTLRVDDPSTTPAAPRSAGPGPSRQTRRTRS